MVHHNGRIYSYGGESYKPYMYHNSVQSLDLLPYQTEHQAQRDTATVAAGTTQQIVVLVVLLCVVAWVASKTCRTASKSKSHRN